MGTVPNGHGMPSTVPTPSLVNASIGNNASHFHGAGAVPSRVNGP